jgi:hypothetical protein
MDDKDFASIMVVLSSAYPNFQMTDSMMIAYKTMLKDIPVEYLKAGALKHASENKWFPTVAELREASFSIMMNKDAIPSEFEAWEEVKLACEKIGHYKEPPFSHPLIVRTVNVMGWKELCLSENQEYDRAHFFKVYKSLSERAESDVKMLPQVRAMLPQKEAIKRLVSKLEEK